MVVSLGFFAIYAGFMYNDFFSASCTTKGLPRTHLTPNLDE